MSCFVLVARLANVEHRLSQSNDTLVWLYISQTHTVDSVQRKLLTKFRNNFLQRNSLARWVRQIETTLCVCVCLPREVRAVHRPRRKLWRESQKSTVCSQSTLCVFKCILYINVCQIMCMLLNAFVPLSEKIYTYKSQMPLIC